MKIVKKFQKFDNKVRKKIGLGFTTKLDNVAHKGFKKVWNNPIGRIVIMAAAIYLGGAALGAWSGPSAWGGAAGAGAGAGGGVGGGLGGGAAISAGGSTAALGAAETAAVFAPAGTGTVLAGSGAGMSGASLLAATAPGAAAQAGAGTVLAATPAAAPTGVGSIVAKITQAAKGVGATMAENKMLTAGAMMMGGQLLQPSQAEIERQQQKRYWSNLNVGNINLGLGGAPKEPIKDMRGNPVYDDNGFISRRLAGTPQPVPVNTGATA